MESSVVVNSSSVSGSADNRFFGVFALFITFIVFGGFGLSWFFNPSNIERVTFWTGLHGVFSSAWYLLLLGQIKLAGKGRYLTHKTFGKLSVFLVLGILLTGSIMAYEFYHRLVGFGVFNPEDAQARLRAGGFLGGVFLQWLIFLVLYALGILSIKNPAHHKRFMIAAAIQMMPEGLNRVTHLLSIPGYSMFVFMCVVYLSLMLFDWKVHNRLYASTVLSFSLFVVLALAMHTIFRWQTWGDWSVKMISSF
ncbi:hypothetical protein [Alteromonas sp. KUL49]|uniref:hypothetical protein n=1 Tax=Alteromonas sp. KUL49 TaxID=2480798 RepID=UPI00102EFC44|nr:hypothetical protein [Alteromonas sp. KUL49]TAP40942.1 hypothetical protein EYS00_07500 [Alteromonas sp. KUL49]GEA11124.1 hypothetical protein KUL49_14990 [Alteromonas sp. KUL49]